MKRFRSIPFVEQVATGDCGAACLAMMASFHGSAASLSVIRELTGGGRDSVDAESLLRAAQHLGFEASGVALDVDALKCLERGSILHWEFRHFVVLDSVGVRGVDVVDPAYGRRCVPWDEVRRAFTGVALRFRPLAPFPRARRPRSELRVYFAKLAEQRGLIGATLGATFLLQLAAVGMPVLSGFVVDQVVPRGDQHLLLVVVVGVLLLGLSVALASMLREQLLLRMRAQFDVDVSVGLLRHLLSLPFGFFQQRSVGDLLMRLSSPAAIREVVSSGAMALALDGLLITLNVGVLLLVSPKMMGLVGTLGAVEVLLFLVSRKRQRDLATEQQRREASLSNFSVEMLSAVETLKASGTEDDAQELWKDLFVDSLNADLARARYGAALQASSSALHLLSPFVLLAFGALQVISGGMSLGQVIATSALGSAVLAPLASLVSTGTKFHLLETRLRRVRDIFEVASEGSGRVQRPAGPIEGRVTLEHVEFRYSPKGPAVLSDISLEIRPGERVAIVGPSGGGKSTLARVILGMLEPSVGRVLFEGVDLAELEPRSLRRQLGIVTQDAALFDGSIRSNIAFGLPDTPLSAVVEAATLACIAEEIEAMPLGYETLIADRGSAISGGQRQRLALARALLRRPRLVVLDEATSHLDTITEERVHRSLDAIAATQIIIAHRLSTVVKADRIVVLEGGRIAEMGTHRELLAKGGLYARLASPGGVPKNQTPA